jgi:16S rRNA (cytosine1402-N4)-methyltransferase
MGLDGELDGVLLDLGVSSPQLDDAARGFSFVQEGPLDMRMNNSAGMTAADWIARAPEAEIARVIREFGEERFAKRIAGAIVEQRQQTPITRTTQLAQIVAAAVRTREPGKHPATRTFQAIRIHVNRELEEIETALNGTLTALRKGGRLAVISFHSLEDTLVKRFMQRHSQEDPVFAGLPEVPAYARPTLRRIGKAIHPTEAEVRRNPRSRSSIMRVAERLAA